MMLPSDIALTQDPAFASWVDAYAEVSFFFLFFFFFINFLCQDEDRFQADFARAWSKLMELGVEYQPKPVLEKLFG